MTDKPESKGRDLVEDLWGPEKPGRWLFLPSLSQLRWRPPSQRYKLRTIIILALIAAAVVIAALVVEARKSESTQQEERTTSLTSELGRVCRQPALEPALPAPSWDSSGLGGGPSVGRSGGRQCLAVCPLVAPGRPGGVRLTISSQRPGGGRAGSWCDGGAG